MVIVAEHITRTTEQNVRHLVREGLPMQCVEVQQHVHPDADSEAVLAAETVVDYALQRVKPEHETTDEYETLFVDVRERIRTELSERSVSIPSDHVTKTPRNDLAFIDKSLVPDLRIAYTVKPYTEGYVTISIRLHYYGESGEQQSKDLIRSLIRDETGIPDDEMLSYDPESSTVVQRRIPLRSDAGDISAESVLEIVDGFVDLVERTYPIFEESMTEDRDVER